VLDSRYHFNIVYESLFFVESTVTNILNPYLITCDPIQKECVFQKITLLRLRLGLRKNPNAYIPQR
jgi:hypothetical protein